jgi:hypothetical protein
MQYLKEYQYLTNLELYDHPKIQEYKQGIIVWLTIKEKIKTLKIGNVKLDQILRKQLAWYNSLSRNPQEYINGEITKRTFWQYLYRQILPELQNYFDAVEQQLELGV